MARYELVFKKSVARDLRDIPEEDVARILKCFDAIADDPRGPGCGKLTGRDRYRARQGTSSIVYEIQDDVLVVTVVRVGHRR
jgi:mRNA interferase RelE/StbE